jgi:hypothetical protein
MNPHELRDFLEEKEEESVLDEMGLALLHLVRRVVARVDELAEILFVKRQPKSSAEEYLKEHEAELNEYVELMGPALFGDLKPLPTPEALGAADAEIALQNQGVFGRRTEAREQGWYIEAVALTAYQLEQWLRIWIVSRGGGEDFHPEDRQQLGPLIAQAEQLGMEPDLVDRLRAFNRTRNRAIHRLLRGEISYEELAGAYDADPGLPDDVTKWVVQHLSTFEEAAPEWDAFGRWMRWAAAHPE